MPREDYKALAFGYRAGAFPTARIGAHAHRSGVVNCHRHWREALCHVAARRVAANLQVVAALPLGGDCVSRCRYGGFLGGLAGRDQQGKGERDNPSCVFQRRTSVPRIRISLYLFLMKDVSIRGCRSNTF